MMSPLRRLGALVGAAALVLGLAACNDLTSSSTSSQVDYAACATDDAELQGRVETAVTQCLAHLKNPPQVTVAVEKIPELDNNV